MCCAEWRGMTEWICYSSMFDVLPKKSLAFLETCGVPLIIVFSNDRMRDGQPEKIGEQIDTSRQIMLPHGLSNKWGNI